MGLGETMKKLIFIILLFSVYSFGQNKIVRFDDLTDSLNTVRALIGTSVGNDTVISGSAIIQVGADSVIVTHGLSSTPLITQLIPIVQGDAFGYDCWIEDITSTTFKIKIGGTGYEALTDPLTISWYAFNASLAVSGGVDYVTPENYGATGTGSSSDVAAINSAIESGKPVRFASGSTYAIDTVITLQSNTHLIGYGATIDGSSMSTPDFRFIELSDAPNYGGTSTYGALFTSDIQTGDYTLHTDTTTSISVGDYIQIYSNDYMDGLQTEKNGEIVRVQYLTDSSIIVDRAILREYSVSNGAAYSKVNFIENVTIEGFTIIGDTTNNDYMRGLYFRKGRSIVIKNCTFKNIHHTAIVFYDMIDSKILNCHFEDIKDNGNGYGITLNASCENILVANNTSRNVKRLLASGGAPPLYGAPINVLVTGNIADSRGGAIDTHGGTINFSVTNNIITSEYNVSPETRTAITIRGGSFNVTGNTIHNTARYGNTSSDAIAITNTTLNPWGGIISNNYIYGGAEDSAVLGTGILIYPLKLNSENEDGVSVMNNHIYNMGIGVYIEPDSTYKTANYSVINNDIVGFDVFGVRSTRSDKVNISNNTLVGDTSSTRTLYGIYLDDSDDNEVLNNKIELVDFGIAILNADSLRIKNNRFIDNTYALLSDTASHYNIYEDNYFQNVGTVKAGSHNSDIIIKQNEGYVTNNNGVDTLAIGFISTVSHGLDITPQIKNIFLTPHTNLTGFSYWVSNITSTTFDINLQEDTSLIGTELVTNGTFDDSASWSFIGTYNWTIDGGVAICDSTDDSFYQNIATAEDSVYRVQFTWNKTRGNLYIDIDGGDITTVSASGTYVFSITAGATSSLGIRFYGTSILYPSSYTIGTLDNVSVKQVSSNGDKIFSWQIKD